LLQRIEKLSNAAELNKSRDKGLKVQIANEKMNF
jgi:hypothetical protein